MEWVEDVDLEEELVSNIITVERHTLYEADVGNKSGIPIVHIASVAYSKRMVDRKVKTVDVGIH